MNIRYPIYEGVYRILTFHGDGVLCSIICLKGALPDYYLFVAGFFPLSQGIIPSRDKSKWNTFSAYLHHFSEVDISCSGAVGATEDALIRFNVKVCRQIRHGISLWNINRYLAYNTASPRQ